MAKKVAEEVNSNDLILKCIEGLVEEYKDKDIFVSNKEADCEFIDIGNIALNYAITGDFDKGLPVSGQVTELHGDSATGKSLLLYNIISAFLEKYEDGVVLLDDAENAYVKYLGSKLKFDNKRMIRISSSAVEEHANLVFLGGPYEVWDEANQKFISRQVGVPLVEKLHNAGSKHILVALDSIAVLSTRHEQEVGLGKTDMSKAKTVKALLRTIMPKIKAFGLTYICTNHVYEDMRNPNPKFPRKIAAGGTGVAYQSGLRLAMAPSGKIYIKETKMMIGVVSRVTTAKNRFAPPLRNVKLEILFDRGINRYSGLLTLLKDLGVVVDSPGGWFKVVDTDIKFQSKNFVELWPKIKEVALKTVAAIRDSGETVDMTNKVDSEEE